MQQPLSSFKGISPVAGKGVYIADSSRLVGKIAIGDDSSIWHMVTVRGDVNYIKIGQRTNIQDGTVLHVTRVSESNPEGYPLIIGDDVTIGHKCMLHGCQLGNRILVGMGAIIMDNVMVEDDVFIGAGTLIPPNKRLESGFLYVGNPMVKKRPLKQAEIDFLAKSAQNYVELKDDYLAD